MAVDSLCGKLFEGMDVSCENIKRKYFQQAVIINKSDIDPDSIVFGDTDPSGEGAIVCKYNVSFKLKTGKKGFLFKGAEKGTSFSGTYDKTDSDISIPQYVHVVNIVLVGADEKTKCILSSLDKGLYVVALQFTDGTVEIYGMENGIGTGDYTVDLQGNGGAILLPLTSNENAPENRLPSVYVSIPAGQENEDFNSLFEATA